MNKTLAWSCLALVAGLSVNVFSATVNSQTSCLDTAVTARIFPMDSEWMKPGKQQLFVVTASGMAHCQPHLSIQFKNLPEGLRTKMISQKGTQYLELGRRSVGFQLVANYMITADRTLHESELQALVQVKEGTSVVASAETPIRIDRTPPETLSANEILAQCLVSKDNGEHIRVEFSPGPNQKPGQAPLMGIDGVAEGIENGIYDVSGDYRFYTPHILIPVRYYGMPMRLTRTDLAGNRSDQSQELVFSRGTVNAQFDKKSNRCVKEGRSLASL
jgi:hypothetical protein